MTRKRLLGLLLVVCMVFSCITPAAAVMAGSDSVMAETAGAQQENTGLAGGQQAANMDRFSNDLLVSADDLTSLPTLRSEQAAPAATSGSSAALPLSSVG